MAAMATVGGGAGVGMVMGLEPAGPGRHMGIGGFATDHLQIAKSPDAPKQPGFFLRGLDSQFPAPLC
jgi:hypothetical protein